MSLCRLMVEDFMYGRGLWADDLDKKTMINRNYNRSDLLFGIAYAEGLLEEGHEEEPFFEYNLRNFIIWANERLLMHFFKRR